MFTGIIEEIGKIIETNKMSSNTTIKINAKKVLEDIKLGDSIAVNGVCLTVTDFKEDYFKADIMNETFDITTFSILKKQDNVNLERALKLSDRLGGHIVTGHIDCVGTIKNINKIPGKYNFIIEIPKEFTQFIVNKGSITIDGISLTVASITNNQFMISIIPHTLENTNLKNKSFGDKFNIETDIIGKYALKQDLNKKSNITMNLLERNGFL
jgi:riboflavin synthase